MRTFYQHMRYQDPGSGPPPFDWQAGGGFATGDLFENPGDYAANGIGGAVPQDFMDLIVQANARLTRFSWYGTSHNTYVDLVVSNQQTPLITFQPSTTSGAPSSATVLVCVNRVKALYPNITRYYEILNEPDLHSWTPAAYAAYAGPLAAAIKGADPACKVLYGGLWIGTGAGTRPSDFLASAISANVFTPQGGNVDYFTLHYPEDANMTPYLVSSRTTLDNNGLQAVGIASTEGGGGKNQTQQVQSNRCTTYLTWLQNQTIQIACCFSPWIDYDAGYQFVNADKTKRLAYSTFQNLMA